MGWNLLLKPILMELYQPGNVEFRLESCGLVDCDWVNYVVDGWNLLLKPILLKLYLPGNVEFRLESYSVN